MSDRIYIKCLTCKEQKIISKRFHRKNGWKFFCCPDAGMPIIDDPNWECVKMVESLNAWFEKHKTCADFGIEVEV